VTRNILPSWYTELTDIVIIAYFIKRREFETPLAEYILTKEARRRI
jgi:hypothetical protein